MNEGSRIAVVGSHQTAYESAKRGSFMAELAREAAAGALENAGLTIGDIDTLIDCSCDMIDGRSISSVFSVEACGGFMKEESKVEDDGAFAIYYALMRLLTGTYKTALVVSYSKTSESEPHYYTGTQCEPFYMKPLGLDALSVSALQADTYMAKHGITREQAARVAVKNRKNAKSNPVAQLKLDLTVDEVLSSEMLASPITRLDSCPTSDGAAAVVLAVEGVAEKITDRPAWITGIGYSSDRYYPGHRDLTELAACRKAAENAYKMAGIKDPLKELDVAEITEICSYHELMLYEALGFCKPGEGGKLVDSGETEITGSLPVNPSGGCISSNPWLVTGVNRVAEAAMQVAGTAGDHQVKGAKLALAHGAAGMALQTNAVYILSS